MNLWNKIVLGTKYIFGGFESATGYLFKLLNDFLGKENVAEKVQKVYAFVATILTYLKKYEKYCPAIWANDYVLLTGTIQTLADVLADGKVSADELAKAVKAVKDAIADWNK